MRIVYLHQYFNLPTDGGSSRTFEMARRLATAGHDVHVVTTDHRAVKMRRQWTKSTVSGFTVHWYSLPYNNKMSFVTRLVVFFMFAFQASIVARRLRGDVVFASSTPLTIAIPAIVATFRNRSRMVFEVRDLWPEVPIAMGVLRNPLLRAAARVLEKLAYSRSSAVIALSPTMKEGVARVGFPSNRITVIPNASDLELFSDANVAGSQWRLSYPWLLDRQMVLYCGTLGRANDVGYLVDLAHEVRKLDPEIRFVVVGDGFEKDKVRNRARTLGLLNRSFFMLPSMPKVDVVAVFSASTLTISTFAPIKELEANSPNKLFDSLAAGRPIAINHGGWQAELLLASGAGLVLDAFDKEAAANALVKLLHDNARLAASMLSARKLAEDRFSRDDLAAELETVLSSAASKWSSQPARSGLSKSGGRE